MTAASPIGMRDDFAVVCENPSGAGMFVPALKALAASLSAAPCVSLVKRRGSRAILAGGRLRTRIRILLGGRILPGETYVRLTDSDIFMWWNHDDQEWSVRAAMPDGHVSPQRSNALALAEKVIALSIEAMSKLTDPNERARGDSVAGDLNAWASAAAAQLPEGSRVACTSPPCILGPETGRRALSGREHDHVSTPVLDERIARTIPPSLHAWINHTWHHTGVPAHHLTISGAFGVASSPSDPMARLRALASVPHGETWAMPS